MGGDHAPDIVVKGASIANQKLPNVRFKLFGEQSKIESLCAQYALTSDCYDIIHSDIVIEGDTKPSIALRQGKRSSMGMAIASVDAGEADCVVSAGNTGALMALTMFGLKRLETVSRPAILAMLPSRNSMTCVLDLGANIEADALNLAQFGVMGECFARAVLGIEKPKIGILNVGEEDVKGFDTLRQASTILRDSPLNLNFHGFVEGNHIFDGDVDVVVTDGFTGNVALKSIEGTSKLITGILRDSLQSSWLARLGTLLSYCALKKFKNTIDPRLYNGAVFLGLNGVSVKSHGGTDAIGFANAIEVATDLVKFDFIHHTQASLLKLKSTD